MLQVKPANAPNAPPLASLPITLSDKPQPFELVLEANPLAKKLGWRWGIPVNGVLCFAFARAASSNALAHRSKVTLASPAPDGPK